MASVHLEIPLILGQRNPTQRSMQPNRCPKSERRRRTSSSTPVCRLPGTISGSRSASLEPDTNSKIYLLHVKPGAPSSLGPAWHSRQPHQRHCGTGIWPGRDLAAGWRDIETPCASLPTRSPSQPRTPARKARLFDARENRQPIPLLSAIRRPKSSSRSSTAAPAGPSLPASAPGFLATHQTAKWSL